MVVVFSVIMTMVMVVFPMVVMVIMMVSIAMLPVTMVSGVVAIVLLIERKRVQQRFGFSSILICGDVCQVWCLVVINVVFVHFLRSDNVQLLILQPVQAEQLLQDLALPLLVRVHYLKI